jgi:hypothetical protein
VDNRLDPVAARFLDHALDRFGVIEHGGLVESPRNRRKVDASAPVFQPDIIAILNEAIYDATFARRPKDVSADTSTVHQQDRPFGRVLLSLKMNKVAGEAISGPERYGPRFIPV